MSLNLNAEVQKAIAKYPDRVQEYKAGNKAIKGLFVGEVMKENRLISKTSASAIYLIVSEELEKLIL